MAGVEQITVEPGEAGMRLDRWFKARYPGLGFGELQKLLRSGQIRLDGGRVKACPVSMDPNTTVGSTRRTYDETGCVSLM